MTPEYRWIDGHVYEVLPDKSLKWIKIGEDYSTEEDPHDWEAEEGDEEEFEIEIVPAEAEDGPPIFTMGQSASVEVDELGCKAAASVLLLGGGNGRVVVPDVNEWIGVGRLERDDELPPRRR